MATQGSLTLGLEGGRDVLTVTALNRLVRQLIEDALGTLWVEGEISNLARPSSGHIYFSLKDATAQVRCAMFRLSTRRLGFEPANGLKVLVRAQAGLYEPRGEYQLVVEHMEPAGAGVLRQRFEALKAKLAAEGLFDPQRKRPLPRVPQRIGIVTSPTGAALRDVLIALRRRFPAVEVLIYPTLVQGDYAAPGIVAALGRVSARRECDVLILTRGGGSLEDLWPFNEETVARAVATCAIPVICGVGHETDFTIADFVADLRAPTPSQAAELAVPDQASFIGRLEGIGASLERFLRRRLREERRLLDVLLHRLGRTHPGVIVRGRQQRLDEIETRLRRAMRQAVQAVAARAKLVERGLTSLSPLATLERGYAIVCTAADGALVTRSEQLEAGAGVDVRLSSGGFSATVRETRDAEEEPAGAD